ncbi:MAG TPA: hypothetical protein VK556_01470 [Candidatus Udaeobacter sp.]|nr:hypothetical protein [Candidatus Udaeobacter sp.]
MKNINTPCTRKQFLLGSSAAAVGLFCGRGLLQAQPGSSPSGPASSATPASADNVPDFPEHHPQFDRARVKRFVIAGHANLPAVKAMLADEPNLINGAIDWGNGDFETALGGASHMGRRDIAEYLLEHNARMDIFAATMLGQIDIVKAAVVAFPNIVNVPGPHGIPLIVHAEKGGAAAQAVLEFLQPLASQPMPRR